LTHPVLSLFFIEDIARQIQKKILLILANRFVTLPLEASVFLEQFLVGKSPWVAAGLLDDHLGAGKDPSSSGCV
jgi:hypothetical protein